MAIKKVIDIDIRSDSKQADKSFKEIKKDIDSIGKSAEKNLSGDNLKKVTEELKNTEKAAKSTKNRLRELEDEMADIGDVNSPQFQKLAKEAGGLKDKINNAKAAVKSMSADFPRLQIGTQAFAAMGGAAQGAMGASQLLGSENEDVARGLQKLVAVQSILNAVTTVSNSLSDETALGLKLRATLGKIKAATDVQQTASLGGLTFAQKAYAFAVGTSTGALKLFRLAMIATGIGAIVIGVIALAMNFNKVSGFVQNLTKKMGVFGQVMKWTLMVVLWPFVLAVESVMYALEALGIVESKEEKASARAHDKKIARINKQKEAEKKLREERAKQHEKEQRNLDILIELAAAEGKSVVELQKEKIKGSIAYQKEQLKEIENSIKQIEAVAASGFANSKMLEEIVKEKRKALELAKNDIEDNEKDLLIIDINAKKDRLAANKSAAAENLAANRRIKDLEISLIKDDEERAIEERRTQFNREIEDLKTRGKLGNETKKLLAEKLEMDLADIKKKATDKEKQAEEALAQFKKAADEKFAAEKEAFEETLYQQGLTKDEAEIQAVRAKYFNLISLAEQYGLDTVALKEKETAELEAIEQTAADKQKALDQSVTDAKLSLASSSFGALGDLATAFASNNEKSQKRAFQINKAVQLAQALISTYQGANAIFASAAANPATVLFPAQPFIAAGAAIAAGLANVANISRTKFQGGGGGASSASAPPSIGGGGGSQPAQFNIIGGTGINQLAQGLGGQNQQPIQTYVVSGDVTTAQGLDRNRIDTATI